MKLLVSSVFFGLLIMSVAGCSDRSSQNTDSSEYYLFVGTYTGEGSEGIYLYRFNSEDGSVDSAGAATGIENPSFLTLSPDNSTLYAVNEIGDSSRATVSSFAFDREEETFRFLNRQSSRGGAPCYISVDQTGQAVFVGNYVGGSLTMFPVSKDGALGEAKTVIRHTGSSANNERQNSPHVHYSKISPDNELLFVTDLGTDEVVAYPFDEDSVSLNKESVISFETAPGAGPRHLAFHPNGQFTYLINELNGTVDVFHYKNQSLKSIQTVTTLPDGYEGAISGADIHLSPEGKFLYTSNREDLNNIVIYNVDQNSGRLKKVGEEPSGGVHPRNFMIDPTGKYLLVANRHSDNIVVFERDEEKGTLTPTGTEITVSQPVSLQMTPVE